MPNDALQWFEISDFSPGIWNRAGNDNDYIASAPPLGACTFRSFGCIALPQGGLGPLPMMVEEITVPELPDWGDGNTYKICGFNAELSFILVDPVTDTNQDNRVEMFFAVEYFDSGSGIRTFRWLRYRIFDDGSPTWETLRNIDEDPGGDTPRYVPMFHTRMNPSDPDDNNSQTVTCAVWVGVPLTGDRMGKAFPDPADASNVSTIDIGDTDHYYTMIYPHQGRVVFTRFLTYARGPDASQSNTDNWYWTNTNDNALASPDSAAFVLENPQGISDACSVSANEFVVIKSHDGGFYIQGDLDNPLIVQLPSIASPYGTNTVKGCRIQGGFAYSAGDWGIYLWSGGDQAEFISPQLDGGFCVPNITQNGHKGQMARWGDWLVAPLGWLYSTELNSWWQQADPFSQEAVNDQGNLRDNIFYQSSSGYRGYLYSCSRIIDPDNGASDRTCVFKWDPNVPGQIYRWESQPFIISPDHQVELRDIVIDALAFRNEITVEVINELDDNNPQTVTWDTTTLADFDEGLPSKLRANLSTVGRSFRIRISVDGTSDDNAAAVIYKIALGYHLVANQPVNIETS